MPDYRYIADVMPNDIVAFNSTRTRILDTGTFRSLAEAARAHDFR